ncbi:hypothetical protein [Actinomyces sp. HMT897]|uniref:hypothetical protein n=1 Tax=Actinomyces sp. HMT897 TaxID=2789424 RepID=UPI00190B6A02|nr:hypothetical protein [Actinomyces sp. HMT897]QQO76999.1 hypothetical protein JJJ15_07810 [Actinomyces sp. HMT897]
MVLLVVVGLVGAGAGYLWWVRPPVRRAPLPPEIEKGEDLVLGPSIRLEFMSTGDLDFSSLGTQRHEWVAFVTWATKDPTTSSRNIELRLGQPVHVQGLGTLTLTWVRPAPPPWDLSDGSGPRLGVNLNPDPGVIRCTGKNRYCFTRPAQEADG